LTTLKITVRPPALTETTRLVRLTRRRAAHRRPTTLTLDVQTVPTVGVTTTRVLRIRAE
jgi:hypothetical protein